MDKRLENTYTNLQKSMRSLLADTTWDKINVKSLCDLAGVSRSTFYSHFKSKDDLLDSLLLQFEEALLAENNARSVKVDGKFCFLPLLLNHVRQNRDLFAKNNTSVEGYAIAIRFKKLITRLVEAELKAAFSPGIVNPTRVEYIAGGIYSSLVQWSEQKEDTLHLKALNELDELNNQIISFHIQ